MSRRWDDNWGCGKTPTYPTPPPGNYYVTDEEKNKWNGKQDALVYDEVPTASSPNVVNSGCLYIAFDEQYKRIRAEYRDYFDSSSSGLSAIANQITAATDLLQVIQVEVHADREAVREDKAAVDQAVITTLSYQNSAASSAQDAKRFRDEAERFRNEAEGSTEICREAIEASKVAVQAKDDAIAARDNAAASAAASAKSATNANNAASRADVYAASASNSEFIAKKSATDAKTFRDETKVFRDEAEKFRNDAFSTTPAGYEEVVNKVNDTEKKVDIIINEGQLGITTEAKGKEITVNDSTNAKLVSFNLHGQSEQNNYSGKNLFDNAQQKLTLLTYENEVYLAKDNDTASTFNLKIQQHLDRGSMISGTQKNIPNTSTLGKKNITFKKLENANLIRLANNGAKSEFSLFINISSLPSNVDYTLSLNLIDNTVGSSKFKDVQLEKGTVATPYEPYVGAKPSPSPDYPQDIITSGESYNLLENVGQTITNNGITFTLNTDGSVTANGTASSSSDGVFFLNKGITILKNIPRNIEYILSGCPKGGSTKSYYISHYNYSGNNSSQTDIGDGARYTITNDKDNQNLAIVIVKGTKCDNLTFYPMLRKATETRTRYMPYKKGSVEVVSGGGQLLNYDEWKKAGTSGADAIWENNGVTLTATLNDAYTIWQLDNPTWAIPVQKAGEVYWLSWECDDNAKGRCFIFPNGHTANMVYTQANVKKVALKTREGDKFLTFRVGVDKAGDTIHYKNIMINKGEQPLPYEPYKTPISSIIPTPDGLNGIKVTNGGNYTDENGQQWITDELVKYEDGSGKYIKRIGREVFDGSEDEGWSTESTVAGVRFGTYKVSEQAKPALNNEVTQNLLCTRYKKITAGQTYGGQGGTGISFNTHSTLYVFDEEFKTTDSLQKFKEKLKSKPFHLIYELKTPQETPLSSEQMAAINALKTHFPTTHVSNDGVCGMEMKYYVDQKNYIDGQIAIMKAQQEQNLLNTLLLMPEETQAKMIENDTNNILKEVQ